MKTKGCSLIKSFFFFEGGGYNHKENHAWNYIQRTNAHGFGYIAKNWMFR